MDDLKALLDNAHGRAWRCTADLWQATGGSAQRRHEPTFTFGHDFEHDTPGYSHQAKQRRSLHPHNRKSKDGTYNIHLPLSSLYHPNKIMSAQNATIAVSSGQYPERQASDMAGASCKFESSGFLPVSELHSNSRSRPRSYHSAFKSDTSANSINQRRETTQYPDCWSGQQHTQSLVLSARLKAEYRPISYANEQLPSPPQATIYQRHPVHEGSASQNCTTIYSSEHWAGAQARTTLKANIHSSIGAYNKAYCRNKSSFVPPANHGYIADNAAETEMSNTSIFDPEATTNAFWSRLLVPAESNLGDCHDIPPPEFYNKRLEPVEQRNTSTVGQLLDLSDATSREPGQAGFSCYPSPLSPLPKYPPLPEFNPSVTAWGEELGGNGLSEQAVFCSDPNGMRQHNCLTPVTSNATTSQSIPTASQLCPSASQFCPSAHTWRPLSPSDSLSLRDPLLDQFLIDCKARGMSYRDIKMLGGFQEAESTLRGRYRTLTKPRAERLRKPEWERRDIMLLLQGVEVFVSLQRVLAARKRDLKELERLLVKVPWKQVAKYMAERGAYKFGNATVKKKYLDVIARIKGSGLAQRKTASVAQSLPK